MPCSILVVEDSEDVRDTTKLALELDGNVVDCAGNGREAIAWLAAHGPPCLILLDLNMPVMDGWEFAEHVGASTEWSDIPIVVVTASTASSRGPTQARAFLTKPVAFDRLVGVTTHCEAHR